MKHLKSSIVFTLGIIMGISSPLSAKENKTEETKSLKKILILGLNDNIKSDYYYKELIAEESGIPADSMELVFNNTIAGNIAQSRIDFTTPQEPGTCAEVINNIKVKGEQENCTSDLSGVDSQCYTSLLEKAGADYVLILNRHYLKKQEEPFNTLFYFVSYSLYNKDKQELLNGSNYFTAMRIESAEAMKKASRKSADKISTSILKLVAKQPTETPLLLSKN